MQNLYPIGLEKQIENVQSPNPNQAVDWRSLIIYTNKRTSLMYGYRWC